MEAEEHGLINDLPAEYSRQERLLLTLQRLLELDAVELHATLQQAAQLVQQAFEADKADVFLLEHSSQTLVALGTSQTPMGQLEQAIGLDRLPLANQGRAVEVFESGEPYLSGHVEQDPDELPGLKVGLGIRSELVVPLEADQQRLGVLLVSSRASEQFVPADVPFLQMVARWVGSLIHRAQLVEQLTQQAAIQGRRMAGEELLTVVAHDLRNYLTPLVFRLGFLERRARSEGRSEDLRDVSAMSQALSRLRRLIEDLLDVRRLEQGLFILNPESTDVVMLVREIAGALQSPQHEIHVQAPQQLDILADANRLRQLLENLLANAVAHAPAQTPIEVRIERQNRDSHPWMVLTVSNQGPGMPAELLEHLFEPFVTGSPSRGLGLGLYLAKRIATAHGATLSVNSQPGAGVQVTLAFPLPLEEA